MENDFITVTPSRDISELENLTIIDGGKFPYVRSKEDGKKIFVLVTGAQVRYDPEAHKMLLKVQDTNFVSLVETFVKEHFKKHPVDSRFGDLEKWSSNLSGDILKAAASDMKTSVQTVDGEICPFQEESWRTLEFQTCTFAVVQPNILWTQADFTCGVSWDVKGISLVPLSAPHQEKCLSPESHTATHGE